MPGTNTSPSAADLLDVLTTPRFALISDHIEAGRWDAALGLLDEARVEHEWCHDGYLNAVARVKTVVLEDFGQDEVGRMGREMPYEGLKLFGEIWSRLDFREAVETAAAGWHWHMTQFRVVEDDEKVSFLLEPCGSGGRLINDGAYYGTRERPLGLVPEASGSTFGMTEFPVYCAHCSELTGFNLQHGVTGWLVEGWTGAHRYGACRQHAYKSFTEVPDEYFRRTDVSRGDAPVRTEEARPPARVFTDEELTDLAVHPIDRLERSIRAHDAAAATSIVAACRMGWGVMQHDSYRDWLSSWYDLVLRAHGPTALEATMSKSAWELFGPTLRDTAGLDGTALLEAWAVYWRAHDAVRSLERIGNRWRFSLDPERLLAGEPARRWPGPHLAGFCDAVHAGLADAGLADRFGRLSVDDGSLRHDLPAAT